MTFELLYMIVLRSPVRASIASTCTGGSPPIMNKQKETKTHIKRSKHKLTPIILPIDPSCLALELLRLSPKHKETDSFSRPPAEMWQKAFMVLAYGEFSILIFYCYHLME